MTISSTANNIQYAGNGVTTAFPTVYEFTEDADLVVNLIDDATGVPTLQTIITDYTVSGAGNPGGGTVTMVVAPTGTPAQTLDITRWINPTQPTDYLVNGIKAEVIEDDFDRAIMISQQILNRVGGATFSINEFTYMARSILNLEEWDASSKVISAVADGVNPQDAATKAQLDAVVIASGNLPLGDPVNNILMSDAATYVTKTPSAARTGLGLVIGTDVQAFDAVLADLSAVSIAKGTIFVGNATDFVGLAVGTDGQIPIADSSQATGVKWDNADSVTVAMPRGHAAGLGISNNVTDAAHDVDIAAGEARDDGNAVNMTLSSSITKQIDAAWAVGTNAGGLDTGAVAADTPYAVWLIRRSDTGVVDVLFSASFSSPTMPTGYDQKFRIRSVVTNGSSNIIAFEQVHDTIVFDDRVSSDSRNNPGTALNALITLHAPPSSIALCSVGISDTTPDGTAKAVLNSTFGSNPAPSATNLTVGNPATAGAAPSTSVSASVMTDASSQVRLRFTVTTSDVGIDLETLTHGYIDAGGRNG